MDLDSNTWEKAESVLAFLKDDLDALGLRAEVDRLSELVRNASHSFPGIPKRDGERFRRDVENFLRYPRGHNLLSEWNPDHHRHALEGLPGRDGPELVAYVKSRPFVPPVSTGVAVRSTGITSQTARNEWYLGAIDMLGFVTGDLRSLEREVGALNKWRQRWVPQILGKLGTIETAVHQQIFGHL
jgi:hypothetical protein